MIKFLIRMCIAVVPYKPWRKRARAYLYDVYDRYHYRNLEQVPFEQCDIKPRSVLLVEPNESHGVVLPGFTKYFQDLGYAVDVMMRPNNAASLPFTRVPVLQQPRIFIADAALMRKRLAMQRITQYEVCFFSTTAFYENEKGESYLQSLGFSPQAQHGVLLVQHDLDKDFTRFAEEAYLQAGDLFTILGFQDTPMLNPHYFGEVAITPKNNVTNFIVVGGISQKTKNFTLLLRAITDLLSAGISNFTVTIVGKGSIDIPAELAPYIECKGSLDYPEMFTAMEEADFILALLDATIPEHGRYRNSCATGTILLVHGFAKPCLMDSDFAPAYGLHEHNAVLYSGDLGKAMKSAVGMHAKEYAQLQAELRVLTGAVYERSLANLESKVHREEI